MKAKRKRLADKGSRHIEALNHFRCASCDKWWTIGDAPQAKKIWFCPWCGNQNTFGKLQKHKMTSSK